MDDNKLQRLKEIGYKVLKCCGTCSRGNFPDTKSNFGTCLRYQYTHLKHKRVHDLSITRFGRCSLPEGYKPRKDYDVELFASNLISEKGL